jgi:hypothetical protein
MASVAGPRPPCGVHPSGCVVRVRRSSSSGVRPVRCPVRPVSSPPGVRPSGVHPSGVQPVRCPVTRVRRPGVRRSGRTMSTRPVSSRLVSAPSVRTRPSGPHQAAASGTADAARQPAPRERVQIPVGGRAVERLGRRPSRPGRGRRRPGSPMVGGAAGGGPGPGAGGGPGLDAGLPAGQAGVRHARRRRRRCGHGSRPQREVAAPAAWLPSSDWVGDHGAWWSWRPPPAWTGPDGADGRAGGMGERPQRGPGSQPALPARR